MKQNYDMALNRLLAHEGGYTNHPSDPGGPTKFGITIHDYRKYVKAGATAADVKAMTLDEAKRIYRIRYWDAQRCDDLPAGVDYAIFDYGVNSGIGRSGKVLRRVVGLPDNTHAVNLTVLDAVRKRSAEKLVTAICAERLAFLKRLKTWPVFGKGWGRRVAEVNNVSLALARKAAVDMPMPEPSSPDRADKGVVPEPKGTTTGTVITAPAGGAAAAWGYWDWVVANPGKAVVCAAVLALAVTVVIQAIKRHNAKQQDAPVPGIQPVPEGA